MHFLNMWNLFDSVICLFKIYNHRYYTKSKKIKKKKSLFYIKIKTSETDLLINTNTIKEKLYPLTHITVKIFQKT